MRPARRVGQRILLHRQDTSEGWDSGWTQIGEGERTSTLAIKKQRSK